MNEEEIKRPISYKEYKKFWKAKEVHKIEKRIMKYGIVVAPKNIDQIFDELTKELKRQLREWVKDLRFDI